MKKYELANYIINSKGWDGTKDIQRLTKNYTKEELEDIYEMACDYEVGYDYMI